MKNYKAIKHCVRKINVKKKTNLFKLGILKCYSQKENKNTFGITHEQQIRIQSNQHEKKINKVIKKNKSISAPELVF